MATFVMLPLRATIENIRRARRSQLAASLGLAMCLLIREIPSRDDIAPALYLAVATLPERRLILIYRNGAHLLGALLYGRIVDDCAQIVLQGLHLRLGGIGRYENSPPAGGVHVWHPELVQGRQIRGRRQALG